MSLTELQSAAIEILVERAVTAKLDEINMAEKLPGVKALPAALAKMRQRLNDAATQAAEAAEKLGDEGATVIGGVSAEISETKAALDEVKQALEGETNGGPLS